MKLKKLMATCAILGYASATHAQSAGDFIAGIGWLHFMPRDSSQPMRITNYHGSPSEITFTGSGAGISNADTVGFTGSYFITDNISSELVLGFPPKFKIKGEGSFAGYGRIGEVRQWSPTLFLKYHFFDAQAQIRPYLGLGVSRVWFKDARLTNEAFQRKFGNAPVNISVKNRWTGLINAGLTYRINERWFAGLSVSYMPLRTEATLQAADGTHAPVIAKTKITVNPIITYLNIAYRF